MDTDHCSSFFLDIQFHSPTISVITAFFLAFIFLLISALLSGAEVALASLNSIEKEKIESHPSRQNRLLASFFDKIEETQTGLSIWNNGFTISIIILFSYALNRLIIFPNFIIEFLCLTCILILIILLFGEIIPRIYAKNNPVKFLTKTAPLIYFFEKTTRPIASFIVKISSYINNSSQKKSTETVSMDELSKALELTSEELSEEKEMLEGIINLYNKTAAEIMTPRMDIAGLDISASFKDVLGYVVEVEFSRIPVFGENTDDVKGVLYIKDLLPHLDKPADFYWQNLIRPAFFVPESKKIDDLLEEFRTNKNHIAIVIDEYGGTCGIVTMEDILEEIVGEINDEYDDDEELKYSQLEDGSFIFQGKIPLTDFFRITNIEAKTFGKLINEVDSLAGLILEIKGDFPELNENVTYGPYTFDILEMDNKRILKIHLQIDTSQENKDAAES